MKVDDGLVPDAVEDKHLADDHDLVPNPQLLLRRWQLTTLLTASNPIVHSYRKLSIAGHFSKGDVGFYLLDYSLEVLDKG